jgi:hypothetical protein
MKYAVEMASDFTIYIPSFLKISTGVQALSRFSLNSWRGYSVGITDERDS